MALVELTRCENKIEATFLQHALNANAISSFIFDAEMSWVGDLIRCRVMVDEDDLAHAKRVLADQPR